jgi:DNA polymerase-3 subunit epsilon
MACYLDVETTGLDSRTCKVIEIGLVLFRYDENGAITELVEEYQGFEDPKEPLTPEIIKLTGITDDMLKGKSIDWKFVEDCLALSEIVLAHNAAFDRSFIDQIVPLSKNKVWGCTVNQIPWKVIGCGCRHLPHLCWHHGFFYDAHRALNDVKAAVQLLTNSYENQTYLKMLLNRSSAKAFLVQAFGAPFEKKDLLKARRFRWNAGARMWEIQVGEEELPALKDWMIENIYQGKDLAKIKEVSPEKRFS